MIVPASSPKHPGWLEITIDIHPIAHEALSALLFDLGCQGMVTEDFSAHTLKAYWPLRQDFEDLKNRIDGFLAELADIFPEARPFTLRLSRLQDQDWAHSWRRFFHPDRITPNLTVFPAWEPVSEPSTARIIRIDPGPAFGTGQHPTTRMCLKAMEDMPLTGSWSMLDIGTGSGILALYGAMLNAARILAIDIDPEALRWAQRNLDLNGISSAVEISPQPLESLTEHFHLVVGNLILGTIVDLFPFFSPVTRPGGTLILSGLLREQVPRVEALLPVNGFQRVAVRNESEWACVIARKESAPPEGSGPSGD
ncbi:MAG: 50S ribosomal protein L11 methyltransferase [Desulfatiglandales bacterium]